MSKICVRAALLGASLLLPVSALHAADPPKTDKPALDKADAPRGGVSSRKRMRPMAR